MLKDVYHLIVRAHSNNQINKKADIPKAELGVGINVELMQQIISPYMIPTATVNTKTKKILKTMDDMKTVGKGVQVKISDFPQTSYLGEVL